MEMVQFSKKYLRILGTLGLNKNEIKFYLASLELGLAPIAAIAKKAGIHRVNAYGIIPRLKEKGLIAEENKPHQRLIIPSHPSRIKELAREQQKKVTRLRWQVEDLVPELLALYSTEGEQPRIRFFEGVEGMKAVYEDTLNERKPMRAFTGYGEIMNVPEFKKYMEQYPDERAARGISIKILCWPSEASEYWAKKAKAQLREQRYFTSQQDFGTEINIYGDKLGILSFKKECVGIIIESKEIAQTLQTIFDELWKFAEPNIEKARQKQKLIKVNK